MDVITSVPMKDLKMKKLLSSLLVLTTLTLSGLVQAGTKEESDLLRSNHPQQHTVVKGDTLWDISGLFLKSPWRWPELWGVNPQVDNPHLIYPGDIIYLTWVNGKPRLSLNPNGGVHPRIRVAPLKDAIPPIPLEEIISFLNKNRVLPEDQLKTAPYVIGGQDQRIIAGEGDRVYARGVLESDIDKQGIYRAANKYKDPVTGEFLGYEILKIADGKIKDRSAGDIITVDITRSYQEVRVKDRLVADDGKFEKTFFPFPAPKDSDGQILSVLGGVRDGGQFNVVAINRGMREDIKAGQVFAIYRKGERVKDPITKKFVTLPEERSGELMVFKVFGKVSYGLVLKSTTVVSIGDQLRAP